MANMNKLSFDFDSTLSTPEVQQFAREFIAAKIAPVAIVTSRLDRFHVKEENRNDDLFAVADWLNISEIHFTNLKDKVEFFLKHPEFDIHLDDCPHEIQFMQEAECKTLGILWWKTPGWEQIIMDHYESLKN